jgi:flagellar hook-associated protein 3 FlgL
MRVTNLSATNSIISTLQSLSSQQNVLQKQASSGLQIVNPEDNPGIYNQVIQLQFQAQEQTQYNNNATQALQKATVTQSALQQMQSIYDQASQLAAQASSGTNNSTTQKTYATQLSGLISQAIEVANTQFQGNYLFAGTAVKSPPFIQPNIGSGDQTVTYTGNAILAVIDLSPSTSVSVSTSGTTNAGFATFINNMISLQTALNTGASSSAISAASTNIVNDEGTITNAVADNGTIQARIQSAQTEGQANMTELNTVLSNDTAADLPTTMVKLNQAQLAYQAALDSTASIMKTSILNYLSL